MVNEAVQAATVQWRNPKDILSVLLVLGGESVQKAIANLVGRHVNIGRKTRLGIVPVAFSFGWVAFSFSALLSSIGDGKLMPDPEDQAFFVNCNTGFARENQSWLLNRILRDHEIRNPLNRGSEIGENVPTHESKSSGPEVLRIDIFNVEAIDNAEVDFTWWSGWVTIAIQIGICTIPLAQYRDWLGLFTIIVSTILALITSSLPQWQAEKWPGKVLEQEQIACLTRGNGYSHVMVLISAPGSWNLEALATAAERGHALTSPILLIFSIFWTSLLITTAGIEDHSWYVLGLGALGTLQNIFAGNTTRRPEASKIRLSRFERAPTIIATEQQIIDDSDAEVDLDQALADVDAWKASTSHQPQTTEQIHTQLPTLHSSSWLKPQDPSNGTVAGLQGALQELERHVPTAGLAMLRMFFAGEIHYHVESVHGNIHKKFWKRAAHTQEERNRFEQTHRDLERSTRTQQP